MQQPEIITLGSLSFDVSANQVTSNQGRQQIEPRVMAVLVYLFEHQGEVVTRDDLHAHIWQGQIVSDNTLTRAISQLRKILEQGNQPQAEIETIPKVGYRLQVTEPANAQASTDLNGPHGTSSDNTQEQTGKPSALPWFKRRVSIDPALVKFVSFVVVSLAIFSNYFYYRFNPPIDFSQVSTATLSALPGVERKPVFSPNGQYLAFSFRPKDSDEYHLYLMDTDNQQTLSLIQSPQLILDIEWSPDGRSILISRWQSLYDRRCVISQVKLSADYRLQDTEDLLECGYNSQVTLGWHPQGNRIYYNDRSGIDQPYAIYSYALDSKRKAQVSLPPQKGNLRGDFALFTHQNGTLNVLRYLSSQRNELLIFDMANDQFVASHQLSSEISRIGGFGSLAGYLIRKDNKLFFTDYDFKEELLVYPVIDNSGDFSVSPDAKKIVFVTGNSDQNIYFYGLEKQQDPELAIASTAMESLPAFANNSQQLAYISDRSGEEQIWLRTAEGHNRQLSESPAPLRVPRLMWSLDDSQILFQYQDEIYTINVTSGKIKRLIDNSHRAYVASWSRDGQSLLYSSEKTGEWQIWKYHPGSATHTQLTTQGGYSAFDDAAGNLYFSKLHEPGLWLLESSDNKNHIAEKLIEEFDIINWRLWSLEDDGVYYFRRQAKDTGIYFYHWAKQSDTLVFRYRANFHSVFDIRDKQVAISRFDDAESRLELIQLN